MNVEDTLVAPDWSIRRVMEQIERNGKGIVLAVDQAGKLLATVTDGDIRRAILDGMDLDLPLHELIARGSGTEGANPITAPKGTPTATLLSLMSEFSIRHVPIADSSGRIIDIALLSDLIEEQHPPASAVIMAGGRGSRLRPLTDDIPKPMLPVGDRPLLETILEQLCEAGINRINLITHYKKEVISNHFGDGAAFGVEIQYVEEDQPLGTAGGLSLLKASNKPLLVINGDVFTEVDFRAMLDYHRDNKADMSVAVKEEVFSLPYGVVQTDGVRITGISEKPVIRHFINAGIYLLEPDVHRLIPSGEHCDMTEIIERLLQEGRTVVAFPIHEYWIDIGQPEDYERARADVASGDAPR